MTQLFDLTGFTFSYEEGVVDTPDLRKALVDKMTSSGFRPTSRGMAMIATPDGVEYVAEIDGKLKHINIGLCEYEEVAPLDAGPFKGKRLMLPRIKRRLDG